jgi:nicotinamidase-related amidase
VTLPDKIDAAATALLVMDYQRGIVERFAGATLLEGSAAAIATARAAGATIGYVRVALERDEAAAVPATNKTFSAAAASGGPAADDPGTQIVDAIAPQDGDIVVRKRRVGAMSTTDLDAQLRARGIDTLILAGISTSGVVLSTIRDAADRDYRLFVIGDLCADLDEEVHRVLLEKVFPRQAEVLTSGELARLFGG